MKNLIIAKLAKEILAERITIDLDTNEYDKLKEISDVKEIFVKDIVDDLIKIYNENAITDKGFQNKVDEEKEILNREIRELQNLEDQDSDLQDSK